MEVDNAVRQGELRHGAARVLRARPDRLAGVAAAAVRDHIDAADAAHAVFAGATGEEEVFARLAVVVLDDDRVLLAIGALAGEAGHGVLGSALTVLEDR